ncbi:unnamed protein product [Sphagnum jensenii]|uniref:Uncharacterized protein n=1 Tax=Sphagnum jensenii TaxID=128206 RepID=A0ABP1BJ39_9BRYO
MSLAGRSSGGEPPTETGPIHRIDLARGGEQFLVVRRDFNQKLKAPLSLNSSGSRRPLRVQLMRGGERLQERVQCFQLDFGNVFCYFSREELIPAVAQHFAAQGDRTLGIGDTALFRAGNVPPFIRIS